MRRKKKKIVKKGKLNYCFGIVKFNRTSKKNEEKFPTFPPTTHATYTNTIITKWKISSFRKQRNLKSKKHTFKITKTQGPYISFKLYHSKYVFKLI